MTVRVAAFCGSLRKASFNRLLLNACQELKPEGMEIAEVAIGGLPHYDQDIMDAGMTPAIIAARDEVAAADALLFVTPEYNYSISGVLKNAIDWLSRPPGPPLFGKAAAILSASTGPIGGLRAQLQLRQMGTFLDLRFVNKPEVLVGLAPTKFADGRFIDETGRGLTRDLLANLKALSLKLKG